MREKCQFINGYELICIHIYLLLLLFWNYVCALRRTTTTEPAGRFHPIQITNSNMQNNGDRRFQTTTAQYDWIEKSNDETWTYKRLNDSKNAQRIEKRELFSNTIQLDRSNRHDKREHKLCNIIALHRYFKHSSIYRCCIVAYAIQWLCWSFLFFFFFFRH